MVHRGSGLHTNTCSMPSAGPLIAFTSNGWTEVECTPSPTEKSLNGPRLSRKWYRNGQWNIPKRRTISNKSGETSRPAAHQPQIVAQHSVIVSNSRRRHRKTKKRRLLLLPARILNNPHPNLPPRINPQPQHDHRIPRIIPKETPLRRSRQALPATAGRSIAIAVGIALRRG